MRCLQLFVCVFFKAAVLLLALKVSYTQTCQSCQYKATTVNTTQISIQVSAEDTCQVHNTNTTQTGGTIIVSDLTPGTTYSLTINCTTECCHNFTTTAITNTSVNISLAELPFANTSFTTRPQGVTNLKVTMLTSESVSLTWIKGEGKSSLFRVLWKVSNDLESKESKDTSDVSATIAGLIPGTKYVFSVKSVAADNLTESNEKSLDVETKPGIPEEITAKQRGNDFLNVSWSKPKGNVEKYQVSLGNQSKGVIHDVTSASFTGLKPGTVYTCTVISVLGNMNSTSNQVEFATKPNPPGSVSITLPTTTSLTLTWSTPLQMSEATNLSYEVSYSSADSAVKVVTVNGTSDTLSNLVSGTQYSINVSTIGPQDLRSTIVPLDKYTLPNPVTNLSSTTLSSSSLRLEWDSPSGYKSYYKYKVQTGNSSLLNVSGNSANINGLNPGYIYNCSVTTIISSDVQGQSVYILGYTKPTHVGNLKAEAINTTYVKLTWTHPTDHKETYSYEAEVVNRSGQNKSTSGNSTIFDNLLPGTYYTFRVRTKANNQTSEPSEVSSFTKVGKATDLIAVGNTTTMRVTWVKPIGNVEMYNITIYQDQILIQYANKTNEEVVFQNLQPGTIYTVTVTTKSGQFEEQSDIVKNATYPNPPRELKIEQYTNSSISFKWESPQNMSGVNYSYIVTYRDTPNTPIRSNNITLNNLLSGTEYNFTVKTLGAMYYESSAVTGSQYTNPNPVRDLAQVGCSTGNITVNWIQSDAKTGYSYQVNVTYLNGTLVTQYNVTATTATIVDLQSGVKYSVFVTTKSAGGTQAPAQSITAFTKPYPITNLVAITQNESAVFLNWTRPLNFPSNGSYYITTNCSKAQPNRTVQVEIIYITELEPGVTCFSTVYSQVNNISGDPVSINYSTKPPKVSPEVMHVGTNGTIYVTWTPVSGVDMYIVTLDTAGSPIQTVNISNQKSTNHNLSHTFSDLLPATVYNVTIKTVSGVFSELSDVVSIATYPTKPGAITITGKKTDSIELAWESAPNMTHASFYYTITYETTGTNSSEITTTNTSQILSGLSSGTTYNISVATVGPMDLKSEPVFMYFVTTKPKSVTSLMVSATKTNTITVQWTPPPDFKGGYKYNVSGSNGQSDITQQTEFIFSELDAGSNYIFSVQTLTADGTAGAVVNVTGCTVASEVSVLNCVGPNKTEAKLSLTWDNPSGSNAGFEIWLGNSRKTIPQCKSTCHHDFSGLAYYKDYTVSIMTKGCGENSSVKSVSCKTGITDPPKTNTEGTVTAVDVEYNKFTLQLSSGLFNSTNGPIVGYGILVTPDTGSINGGLATSYLTKTYSDWTAGKTTTYLAVVQQFKSGAFRTKLSTDPITVVVGDETNWEKYVNGPLSAKGSYSYAVVIFTKLEVDGSSGLISTTQSYFSITAFHSTPVDLPENPAVIGGAIGGGIAAVVIILVVIMIVVATFKRKKNKEDSPGVPIHSIRNKVSEPIKVENYEAHYRRQRADSFCGFAEEFEDLKPVGIAQAKSYALAPENRAKNRYNNVLPYDNSRVRLSILGSPFDDYINASNMPGYNSRKEFIAAQGPLAGTVNDFWRMIWEKNVHTVVMLTRCNEQGRVKCEEYWPAETKHYGNLVVTTTSEIPLEDWTIRDFDVKNVRTAETRAVRHFHFTAWPDHGVPETTELLINFRHLVREHMDQYSRHSPTVVHCSAGVGRTGTFIAIDRLIFQIERDGVVDIYGIIHDLRMHRTLMVQTEDQYVFLNQCAIDIIRSRTGTNVDLIYQNTAALTIYENFEPMKKSKNGYHKA